MKYLIFLLCALAYSQPVPLGSSDAQTFRGQVPCSATITDNCRTTISGGVVYGGGSGSADASTNTTTSVDGEAAVFSGTGGKLFKRFSGTGVMVSVSGVPTLDSGLQFNFTTKAFGVFGPITSGQTGNYQGRVNLQGLTSGTWSLTADADGSGASTIGKITATGGFFGALTGLASTATALAANGANCSAGSYPLGVDASGAAEDCTAVGAGTTLEMQNNAGAKVMDASKVRFQSGSGLVWTLTDLTGGVLGASPAIDSTVIPAKNAAGTFTSKQIFELIGITPSTAPGTPTSGQVYVDSTANVLGSYNGSAWKYYATNPGTTLGDIYYCSDTATPCALTRLAAGTSGYFLRANGAGAAPSYAIPALSQISGTDELRKRNFGAAFDGGGTALTARTSMPMVVPFACTISAWNIMVAPSGTATVKLWKVATGTAIPTIANVINTSGVSISSGTAVRSTTLTDFTTTAVAANDMIIVALTAVDTATQVVVSVQCDI